MTFWYATIAPTRMGEPTGYNEISVILPNSSANNVALFVGTCAFSSPGMKLVHIPVAIAEPTELPTSVMRRTIAVTVATSTCETAAWADTWRAMAAKPPPMPWRIWQMTKEAVFPFGPRAWIMRPTPRSRISRPTKSIHWEAESAQQDQV